MQSNADGEGSESASADESDSARGLPDPVSATDEISTPFMFSESSRESVELSEESQAGGEPQVVDSEPRTDETALDAAEHVAEAARASDESLVSSGAKHRKATTGTVAEGATGSTTGERTVSRPVHYDKDLDTRPGIGGEGAVRSAIPTFASRPDEQYRMSHCADAAIVRDIAYAAASVRGALHEETRMHRQDAFGLGVTEDSNWLIGVIADGVSAAPRSHVAAEVACQVAVQTLRAQLAQRGLEGLNLRAVAESCQEAIRSRARPAITDPQKYSSSEIDQIIAKQLMATTLHFLVMATQMAEDSLEFRYATGAVSGDGNSYRLDADGSWHVTVAGKRHGGIIDNSVRALPLDPGDQEFVSGSLRAGQAAIISTDGLDLGEGNGDLADYLSVALRTPVRASTFLSVMDFVQIGATDDRTAIAFWV